MNSYDMTMAHRYLDNDLSPPEQEDFKSRLAEDKELAAYLEDLRNLDESLISLGLEKAPEISLPSGPAEGLREAFRTRWSFSAGQLLAAGSLAVLLMLFLAGPNQRQAEEQVIPAVATGEKTASSSMRLVYFSGEARSVSVIGSFNGWEEEVPLYKKGDSDYWTVELKLEPGEYQYVFLVDGQKKVVDATADFTLEDDYGSRNSVLRVGL
jgi:hypothetical protein